MTTINILCDEQNPAHPAKHPRPRICAFIDDPDGDVAILGTVEFPMEYMVGQWWQVVRRGTARNEGLRSGVALAGAQPVRWSDLDGPDMADRAVFEISCPWCRRPQQFRDANLFPVLGKLATADAHEITLMQLSAIIGSVARRNR